MNYINGRNMKKFGFTLAEVLITLGIIGVVAAMTIPNLLTKMDHNAKIAKLQKSISIMNQAMRMSIHDNGEYDGWDSTLSPKPYVEQYFAPYLKIVTWCDTAQKCGYKKANPWDSEAVYTGFLIAERVPFVTLDGIMFSVITSGGLSSGNDDVDKLYDFSVSSSSGIIVDINVANNPNRFGNDIFFLVRTETGSVMPLGYNLPDSTIKNDCQKNKLRIYCAERLRRNGWKAPQDYPW